MQSEFREVPNSSKHDMGENESLGDSSEDNVDDYDSEEENIFKEKFDKPENSKKDENIFGIGEGRRSGRYTDENLLEGEELSKSEKGILDNKNIPFILVAHKSWARKDHVECIIVRDRSSISGKLYPTYELILEGSMKVLIVAKKMTMNSKANYHLFDMTRGTPGTKLTKKSANYMGKLRSQNSTRTDYLVVNSSYQQEVVAGISFERPSVVQHLKDGSQPRKMNLILPTLDGNNMPIPQSSKEENTLLDFIHDRDKLPTKNYLYFHSKEPVFENGNYRLNFKGRVSVPSVKNFQLVPEDNIDDVVCQFGKVGDDRFHLDFKAPLNAFQAFCTALAQFNF